MSLNAERVAASCTYTGNLFLTETTLQGKAMRKYCIFLLVCRILDNKTSKSVAQRIVQKFDFKSSHGRTLRSNKVSKVFINSRDGELLLLFTLQFVNFIIIGIVDRCGVSP